MNCKYCILIRNKKSVNSKFIREFEGKPSELNLTLVLLFPFPILD